MGSDYLLAIGVILLFTPKLQIPALLCIGCACVLKKKRKAAPRRKNIDLNEPL